MPFRIRTKLAVAFLAIIFPFIAIVGAIVLYNINTIRKASLKAEAVSEELHTFLSLQLAMDKALMPGNDYIITGDKRYIDEFKDTSKEVEELMKKVEEILTALKGMEAPEVREETEIFKSVTTAWQNIKEISQRIFALHDPTGKDAPAERLYMEEMDYKWAYPAIKMLDKYHEIDRKEHAEAVEELQSGWRMAGVTMIGGAVILITFGVFFALFYSRLFTKPIEAIHDGANAIAKGDFKTRLDIRTGDELQQLSDAMNEMAEQLDSFYGTIERQVQERTRELRESEERYRVLGMTAPNAIICLKAPDTVIFWNRRATEIFGYSEEEVIGKPMHGLIVPERYREKAGDGLKNFFKTGTGPIVGKKTELSAQRRDGTEFPIELSLSAMNIRGEWQATGIVRDITERKQAEEALKQRIDDLEQFRKVTIKREIRMEELQRKVEEMERKLWKG